MDDRLGLTRELLEYQSVDHWEIFSQSSDSLRVEVRDREVDSLYKTRLSGMAVRVLHGNRVGFSFTAALDTDSLKKTVHTAVSMSRLMPPDPDIDLAGPAPIPDLSRQILRQSLLYSNESTKLELARNIEDIAKRYDRRITTVRAAGYSDVVTRTRLMNSLGLDATCRAGLAFSWIELMAEEGSHQEAGYWMEQARSPEEIDAKEVAVRAAQRALSSLGGEPVPSARMPVVVENTVAADLLRILSVSFLGESHYKKKASPKIRAGVELFSPKVSILDDPFDPRGTNSFPFDGEGTPASRTHVVNLGKVEGLLFDRYHAKKFGARSTGNCQRASFESVPLSGVTNMVMEPGTVSFDLLLEKVERGLLITDMMGLHTANPISGDFSVGASGFLIEGGRIARPAKGVAVAGNIIDLFAHVVEVADDLRFFGNFAAPSFRVDSLQVSGT